MNSHQEIESSSSSNERKEQLEDIKLKLERIWTNIPLFLKCYFIITIIFYILTLKIKIISFYLINIPLYTIAHFQLWRLVTSVFITTNIFQIILAFIVWVKYASILEVSLGTIKYTLIFLLNAICIQIINLFVIAVTYIVNRNIFNPEIKAKNNSGIWGIVMCEMTLLCMSNPESPMKLLLLPFTVKAKIYPIILVLLFILSNYLEVDPEIVSGIIYGIIYFYFLKSKFQISDTFVKNIETTPIFKGMNNMKGFVSVTQINNGTPASITQLSTIDNEQEKEKLKGKGVVVAGSLDNIHDEEEHRQDQDQEQVHEQEHEQEKEKEHEKENNEEPETLEDN